MAILKQLPPPPEGKTGFPWTEETPPEYNTENLPTISIITPSFNQGKFIEETIRSVLLQAYPNLEYIIIDGGSTDETLEIIEKYSDFITYWVSEPDKGQSDAINKGLVKATGDIFNWLNSDDYYLPNALLSVGQHFAENKDLHILGGQLWSETNEGKRLENKGIKMGNTVEETLASRHFCQPSTFFRLSVVKQLGGISTDLFFCMDLELWINYLTHFGHQGIVHTDDFFVVFRLHEEAKTSKSHYIRYTDHINILLSLVDSCDKKIALHTHFQGDNAIFKRYFYKKYTINTFNTINTINQKKLCTHIAENFLEYYCEYMSWQSVFSLYFYILKTQPLQDLSWRFYSLPFVKIKRIIRPIN